MATNSIGRALREANDAERTRLGHMPHDAPGGIYDRPVFGEGPTQPWLMLIGEAPGAQEVKEGHPFVGAAGRQLSELLEQADIDRRDVYITNVVKYRPVTVTERSMRNRTPGAPEIAKALPLLLLELELLRPACVATLGNVPLNATLALCGEGRRTIGDAHGSPLPMRLGGHAFQLFPLYHPASVIYNRALKPVCEQDARALGSLYAAQGGCEVNKR